MRDDDLFDLDDLKPRHATELDTFIAAGVREVEQQRAADPDPRPTIERRILNGTLRPDWTTHAEVFQWQEREDKRKAALSRAWEEASAGTEGQVVS